MADLEKAFICDPDTPSKKFYVQFNPNTLEYSAARSEDSYKGVTAQGGQGSAKEPQKQSPPVSGPEGSMLSVKLFYHTYTSHEVFSDVRAKIYNIRAFLPSGKGNDSASSPRMCRSLTDNQLSDSVSCGCKTIEHVLVCGLMQVNHGLMDCIVDNLRGGLPNGPRQRDRVPVNQLLSGAAASMPAGTGSTHTAGQPGGPVILKCRDNRN